VLQALLMLCIAVLTKRVVCSEDAIVESLSRLGFTPTPTPTFL
jgi:hypothetical protein